MPVSGLLITLSPDENGVEEVVQLLQARREIMVGVRQQQWLPVAVDGRDEAHSREVHDWIARLRGVSFVDVVSVCFDEAARDCEAA